MKTLVVETVGEKNFSNIFLSNKRVNVVSKEEDYNDYDERGCMSY